MQRSVPPSLARLGTLLPLQRTRCGHSAALSCVSAIRGSISCRWRVRRGACAVDGRRVQSRLLSAVLTGMNRAFPFAKLTDSTVLSKHIDALYRLTHVGGFGTSLQSLILLFQVGAGHRSVAD